MNRFAKWVLVWRIRQLSRKTNAGATIAAEIKRLFRP